MYSVTSTNQTDTQQLQHHLGETLKNSLKVLILPQSSGNKTWSPLDTTTFILPDQAAVDISTTRVANPYIASNVYTSYTDLTREIGPLKDSTLQSMAQMYTMSTVQERQQSYFNNDEQQEDQVVSLVELRYPLFRATLSRNTPTNMFVYPLNPQLLLSLQYAAGFEPAYNFDPYIGTHVSPALVRQAFFDLFDIWGTEVVVDVIEGVGAYQVCS